MSHTVTHAMSRLHGRPSPDEPILTQQQQYDLVMRPVYPMMHNPQPASSSSSTHYIRPSSGSRTRPLASSLAHRLARHSSRSSLGSEQTQQTNQTHHQQHDNGWEAELEAELAAATPRRRQKEEVGEEQENKQVEAYQPPSAVTASSSSASSSRRSSARLSSGGTSSITLPRVIGSRMPALKPIQTHSHLGVMAGAQNERGSLSGGAIDRDRTQPIPPTTAPFRQHHTHANTHHPLTHNNMLHHSQVSHTLPASPASAPSAFPNGRKQSLPHLMAAPPTLDSLLLLPPSPHPSSLRSPSPDSDNERSYEPVSAGVVSEREDVITSQRKTGTGSRSTSRRTTSERTGVMVVKGLDLQKALDLEERKEGDPLAQTTQIPATPSSKSFSSVTSPPGASSSLHPSASPSSTSTTPTVTPPPLRLHLPPHLNDSPAFSPPTHLDSLHTVWIGTWNLHAKPFPQNLNEWIDVGARHDIYCIGTEECENSIEASLIFSSKAKWVKCVTELLGSEYKEITQNTLQAIHCIVFIKKELYQYVHHIETATVATGIGNVIGNKGGVGISFHLRSTSFLFINAHFAAHQTKVEQRNEDFRKINEKMMLGLGGGGGANTSTAATATAASSSATAAASSSTAKPSLSSIVTTVLSHPRHVCSRFQRVFFLGDLNYRLNGNRRMIEALIQKGMKEVMLSNDQLNLARAAGQVFDGFIEGAINFNPTYKYDANSTVYDTSKKRRIPSYTDRILWKANEHIQLLKYDCVDTIRTSDHRPVYATFNVKVREHDDLTTRAVKKRKEQQMQKFDQNGSRACVIQ